ncbi:MAG: hypothetical protein GSR77_01580 [Desulfurococcales archaeon]|nr:hypothetical protein [Desulfurococcales archaeon]
MSAEQVNNGGNDIKELIRTLKELVLELRSVVDEISNPLLQPSRPTQTIKQTPTQEESKSKKQVEVVKTLEAATPSPLPSQQLATIQSLAPSQTQHPAPKILKPYTYQEMLEFKPQEKVKREEIQVSSKSMEEMNLEKLASLLRLVYELQSRVPPEYLHTLADILMKSSLIDETQKETLEKIIELGKISYKYELGVDESIAILAALAKELGLDVASITEELVRSILRRRGAEAWESQQP